MQYGKKNEVTIKYHVNGGSITKNTKSDSNVEYTWTTTDGYVYKNGTLLTTKIKYGEEMDENGLKNYNNSKYLEISKSGYVGSSKNEWKCTSGDCTDKTYNQNKVYNASDFCDSSNGDCTVVLKVNWVSNPPVITFTLKDSTSTATCTDSITGNVIKTDTKTVGDSTHTLTCENSGVSATCSQKYKTETTTATGLYSCSCPGRCGDCNGVFCYSCCNYCGTSTSTTVSKDGNMSCN